ncbi:MAG: RluA family pseudouridine synthase [Halanaerobiaceae bacterium]
MKENKKFKVNDIDSGLRIDKYLSVRFKDYSRSFIQDLISGDRVKVNGKPVKKSCRLNEGNRIEVCIPEPKEPELKAVKIDLDIIYEDKEIIVINKPAGLVVHPGPKNENKTLVHGLLHHVSDIAGVGGVKRPGIVHRLDKNTSGVLVAAKTDRSHRHLCQQFENRKVDKIYRAVVDGRLEYRSGKIDAPIGRDPDNRTRMAVVRRNSKEAVTYFEVLMEKEDFSYLELKPVTGRTHQLRVHLAYIGHPVTGDKKYGSSRTANRHFLHAQRLCFRHPVAEEMQEFTAPLPVEFNKYTADMKRI